jgi:hypothetical protein
VACVSGKYSYSAIIATLDVTPDVALDLIDKADSCDTRRMDAVVQFPTESILRRTFAAEALKLLFRIDKYRDWPFID